MLLQQALATFLVFAEPGFPVHGVPKKLPVIPGAVVCKTVKELGEKLAPGSILVWRHGSTFPTDAWPALMKHLERGGSMLYLGGEPFTRPVTGAAGKRQLQARTVSMLKALQLNQSYQVAAGNAVLRWGDEVITPAGARAAVLEPRFAATKDFEHEDGAPGARDAILTPMGLLYRRIAYDRDKSFPFATASYAIDQLRGRFAGGRWVFWLLSTGPSERDLRRLLAEARKPPVDLRLDPTFGCFHAGEEPSVQLRIYRPRASKTERLQFTLSSAGTGDAFEKKLTLDVGRHGSKEIRLGSKPPGLHRVRATLGTRSYETGFWVMDRKLFESGAKITYGNYTLRKDGVPEPAVGTTVMSRTVHRKFLFEPNAAVWDDTFKELRSLNINLVRTGMWSAFRKFTLHPNVVDEAFLRSLEAYYLSARRHGIPVIFTFFAFVPESFGGKNPYLDPRAIEGQRAYLSAVASRFKNTKEMIWDLINEPSFSNPKKLWRCRPTGDAFEKKAFLAWLEKRYGKAGAGKDDKTWQDVVRARWRLLPTEAIGLPTEEDFADRHVMEKHRPYRAKEYCHFAQDAFVSWVNEMTAAIRQAGSVAAITVGQDEGGLYDRPGPLLHHHSVAFTSMHTWWNNDSLLWDGLMAKAPGKPLLISETGIMQREKLSGEAIRTPQDFAALLSRKVGYSFACGGFGLVQWAYDVNPYLAIDNEAAIGLRRVDGSYKPEHRVLSTFAGFVQRNKRHFDTLQAPKVVLVMPHGDHFSPRGLQTGGTRRAVQILQEKLGVDVQVVSEYRTGQDLGTPQVIVLPACRGISELAWRDILKVVEAGGILLCSGWFEADDAGQTRARIRKLDARLRSRALAQVEPSQHGDLRYGLDVQQSVRAVAGSKELRKLTVGRGHVLHNPAPIEWSQPCAAQHQLYQEAVARHGSGITGKPGVLVRILRFRSASLFVVINERSTTTEVDLPKAYEPRVLRVPPGRCRMFLFDAEHRQIDKSHD